MTKRSRLIFLLFWLLASLASCCHQTASEKVVDADTLGYDTGARAPFHVKAGEVRQIPARVYTVDDFIIEKGAVLRVVPNQQQWLVFDISGDAVIDGLLEYRRMRPVTGSITTTAPDGRLCHIRFS